MKLLRLTDLVGTHPNLRVDLRLREPEGSPLFEFQREPQPGVLTKVEIIEAHHQSWLAWHYIADGQTEPAKMTAWEIAPETPELLLAAI